MAGDAVAGAGQVFTSLEDVGDTRRTALLLRMRSRDQK
jgi:hypothetical protein